MKRSLLILCLSALLACFSVNSVFASELSENEKKETVVKMVKDAVAFIQANGIEKAKKEIADPKGQFNKGEFYIFVLADDGMTIVNGGVPVLTGRNVLDFKDSKDRLFVRDFMKLSKEKGSGWVDYYWTHKVTKKMMLKHTYLERVPDQKMTVLSGY